VRYLSIAHNERRPGGPSVAKVLLPLGREDRLDVEALRRLVGSINRYLEEDAGSDADTQVGADAGGGLTITGSRPAGGAWLLDGLWQQLGIGTALREVLGVRRFGTDMERMAFALVANRALAPASKLAAAEWITRDVAVPGLAEASDDQSYRAMDLLIEADTDARVQEAVFFAVANLLTLEVDLLFFDTTSTYFERETEDPPSCAAIGEQTEAGFRRYGPFRALQRASAHTRVVAPASPPPRDTGSWCSRSNGPRALPQYQQVTAGSVSGSSSGRGS